MGEVECLFQSRNRVSSLFKVHVELPELDERFVFQSRNRVSSLFKEAQALQSIQQLRVSIS